MSIKTIETIVSVDTLYEMFDIPSIDDRLRIAWNERDHATPTITLLDASVSIDKRVTVLELPPEEPAISEIDRTHTLEGLEDLASGFSGDHNNQLLCAAQFTLHTAIKDYVDIEQLNHPVIAQLLQLIFSLYPTIKHIVLARIDGDQGMVLYRFTPTADILSPKGT